MTSSLSPGPDTFTLERLRAVWQKGQSEEFRPHTFANAEYDANNDLKHKRHFCLKLHASVQDPVHHVERLHAVFESFVDTRTPKGASADLVRIPFSLYEILQSRCRRYWSSNLRFFIFRLKPTITCSSLSKSFIHTCLALLLILNELSR